MCPNLLRLTKPLLHLIQSRDLTTQIHWKAQHHSPLPRLLIPRPRPIPVGHSRAQWPVRPHLKHSLLLMAADYLPKEDTDSFRTSSLATKLYIKIRALQVSHHPGRDIENTTQNFLEQNLIMTIKTTVEEQFVSALPAVGQLRTVFASKNLQNA